MRLQPYSFKVTYRPGSENAADALSRLSPGEPMRKSHAEDDYAYWIAFNAVPKAIRPCDLEEISATDGELCNLRRRIKTNDWVNCDAAYKKVKDEFTVIGKLVLRADRIVMPTQLREKTLMLAHEGHQGIVRTKQRLREKVWWPSIDRDAEHLVRNCHACQLVGSKPKPEPVTRTPLPDGPWQELGIDLCGPFPTGENLLVVTDYYTRWMEVAVIKSTTTTTVINNLEPLFARFGLPVTVVTDNGPQFRGAEFSDYMTTHGIQHRRVTPYWPQANGQVSELY